MRKYKLKIKKRYAEEKYIVSVIGNIKQKRKNDIINIMDTISELWKSKSVKDWSVSDARVKLEQIMNLHRFPEKYIVVIEVNYVDKVYREIYYHHYASRHFSQPRNCIRLFFLTSEFASIDSNGSLSLNVDSNGKSNGSCFGVCVLQPNGVIGRSYWNPNVFLESGTYVRTSKFSVTLLGLKLEIEAFPYMMQDQEATTCAEVTVLNLIDYYSNSYSEYNSVLLSDIERVEAQHSAERVFPSKGMSYADVSRSLAQTGLSPILYASKSSKLTEMFMHRYIYYYVESGIPFGIAVESSERGIMHSIICIGHGPIIDDWVENNVIDYLSKDKLEDAESCDVRQCWIANLADAHQTFIVMDDNETPYQTVKLQVSSSNQWTYPQGNLPVEFTFDYLCIPLYKRVFLSADGAEELFTSVLTSRVGYGAIVSKLDICSSYKCIGSSKSEPLIIRIFLASSRTFLSERIRMFESIPSGLMDEELEEVYQNLYCPRFVWICELYSYSSYYQSSPKAIGEIVADATARQTGNTDSLDGIVLIHYPYYITYRGIDSNWQAFESNSKNIKKWCPFEQFRGNLSEII